MAKTERVKQANRLYINDAGTVVDDEQDATGVRYEKLGNGPDKPPTFVIETYYKDYNDAGKRLGWAFGTKTLIGNYASSQDLSKDEIEARLATIKAGEWPEREGVGGPRYDVDQLALAIAKAKKVDDPAPFLKRITEEKGYGTMALKVPAVQDAYNKLMGKEVKLSDL